MSQPLAHVYLAEEKPRGAEGQPVYAGRSGAAALTELEKANGPGNLKDPAGVYITSDKVNQNLPGGDYVFTSAGEPDMHNAAAESLVLDHHLQRLHF